MTENSTESQSNASTQGFSEALPSMVESLLKAMKELQGWAQFGAFFLVVALIATVIATVSITDNDVKFRLILAFFLIFTLFVLFLYAISARGIRLEEKNLNDAKKELQAETNKRINCLGLIRKQLQDIEKKLEELPSSAEIEFLKKKVSTLLGDISEDLEAVDQYRRHIAVAAKIEDRTKNLDLYRDIEAKLNQEEKNK